LLLHDRPWPEPSCIDDIAGLHSGKIKGVQLAVDRQVDQCAIARRIVH
jgi:hypothetical protein